MACVCNLADIDRNCGRNAPGLKTVVRIACVDDITSIGAATAHVVATITPVTDQGFFSINVIRKDNDLKVTPQEDGGYNTEGTFFISKQAAAKHNILTNLSSDENYLVITEDQNDVKEIIGTVAHPCRLTVEAVKTPKNGYNLKVLWDGHADLPLVFSGTIPTPA